MEGSGQVPREASWEPVRCRRWASTCTPGAPGREVPGAGGLRPVTPRGSGDFPGWKQAFVLVLPNPAPHPPTPLSASVRLYKGNVCASSREEDPPRVQGRAPALFPPPETPSISLSQLQNRFSPNPSLTSTSSYTAHSTALREACDCGVGRPRLAPRSGPPLSVNGKVGVWLVPKSWHEEVPGGSGTRTHHSQIN